MPAANAPFSPAIGATITLSVTAANTQGTLTVQSNQVRVYNAGTNKAFIRWGNGAQTATTADMPVAPGSVESFSKASGDLGVAAICAGGETATVYVTPGEGA